MTARCGTLQTIGRQAGFAEAELDKAVSGLEATLDNFKFTADDKARYAARPRRPAYGDAADADHA